jgi:hypothetical protein
MLVPLKAVVSKWLQFASIIWHLSPLSLLCQKKIKIIQLISLPLLTYPRVCLQEECNKK